MAGEGTEGHPAVGSTCGQACQEFLGPVAAQRSTRDGAQDGEQGRDEGRSEDGGSVAAWPERFRGAQSSPEDVLSGS